MEEYLQYLKSVKNKSDNTIAAYRDDLKIFEEFMKDNFEICEVTVNELNAVDIQDLHAFVAYLDKQKNSNRTKARRISAIRSYFKFLYSTKRIERNPALDLESPKPEKRLPIYLQLDEAQNLLNSSQESKRDFAILTLFLNCGLRLSELISIDIDNIKTDTLTVIGKGNKERTIYLNDACLKALNDYMTERKSNSKALFLSNRNMRFSSKGIQYTLDKYLKRTSLTGKGYSPHKLRHTAATLMYQYGHVDIRTLQEILGHESVATTQIYTHVSDKQLKNAVKNNPLNSIEGAIMENGHK